MIYRDFQDIKISGLGLGMMRLPVIDGDDSRIDEVKSAEMIDYAMKNGINYYDTAWGYHSGNSEFTAGKFLSRYPRDSYYLASKFPGYDNSNMPKVKEIFDEPLISISIFSITFMRVTLTTILIRISIFSTTSSNRRKTAE